MKTKMYQNGRDITLNFIHREHNYFITIMRRETIPKNFFFRVDDSDGMLVTNGRWDCGRMVFIHQMDLFDFSHLMIPASKEFEVAIWDNMYCWQDHKIVDGSDVIIPWLKSMECLN